MGHERTLAHFREEHARDVAADATSRFSVSELLSRSTASNFPPAATAVSSVGNADKKKARRAATLTTEVLKDEITSKILIFSFVCAYVVP